MKRSGLFVGMLALVVAFGVLTGCSTVNRVSRHYEEGGVYQDISVPNKDFQSLGLVFAEYTREGDGAGGEKGEVYTFYKLLQEAKKLGADSIVNVKIEGNYADHTDLKLGGMIKKDQPTSKTWFGSATAIKYTDTIKDKKAQAVQVGTGDSAQISTVTEETYNMAGEKAEPPSSGLFSTTSTGKKKWWQFWKK
ncbi:hypothetical protein AGMMS49942_03910 [Spirochaetia bacterium]|nr:hypothetical protein AGMMS49942_03910 [Spirochaetia bacterium]